MQLAKGFGDSNRWTQSDIPSQRISRVLSNPHGLSHSPIRNSPCTSDVDALRLVAAIWRGLKTRKTKSPMFKG
jgi:hypothetical protein